MNVQQLSHIILQNSQCGDKKNLHLINYFVKDRNKFETKNFCECMVNNMADYFN